MKRGTFAPARGSMPCAMARDLGAAFGQARQRYGETQRGVALALGLHQHTVSSFERGLGKVNLGIALHLLDHFDLRLVVRGRGRPVRLLPVDANRRPFVVRPNHRSEQ